MGLAVGSVLLSALGALCCFVGYCCVGVRFIRCQEYTPQAHQEYSPMAYSQYVSFADANPLIFQQRVFLVQHPVQAYVQPSIAQGVPVSAKT